ncbi:hypothetical protein F5Y13DRAFT_53789 [Hypoxylon sp. FL1857]|nr:hypothetical protein F5Y13DRAFT_53789 [Hypoxylon sp. FL1857]
MAQLHFPRFTELPAELRLQIWETALYQETEKRFVVVDFMERVVYPMRRLISPLLTVSSESRETAEAFFNLTLDVHRVPNPKVRLWPRKEIATGPSSGKLYLNLDRDLFVTGPLWEECRYSINLTGDRKIVCNYDTKPISSEDCNRVQRVLKIEIEKDISTFDDFSPGCSWCQSTMRDADEMEFQVNRRLFSRATERFELNFNRYLPEDDDLPEEDRKLELTFSMILELGGEAVLALPWVQRRLRHKTLDKAWVEEHIPEENMDGTGYDDPDDWDEEIISGVQLDDDDDVFEE